MKNKESQTTNAAQLVQAPVYEQLDSSLREVLTYTDELINRAKKTLGFSDVMRIVQAVTGIQYNNFRSLISYTRHNHVLKYQKDKGKKILYLFPVDTVRLLSALAQDAKEAYPLLTHSYKYPDIIKRTKKRLKKHPLRKKLHRPKYEKQVKHKERPVKADSMFVGFQSGVEVTPPAAQIPPEPKINQKGSERIGGVDIMAARRTQRQIDSLDSLNS